MRGVVAYRAAMPSLSQPPTAKTVPTTRSVHGTETVDEYAWLQDKDDPEVRAYLEAENAYTEAMTSETKDLQQTDLEVAV